MLTITRPTTVSARDRFARLPESDRATVKDYATKYATKCAKASDAWTKAFELFEKEMAAAAKPERAHGGGMPAGHTFARVVGHRLVRLTTKTGSCSCGVNYSGTDTADVRGAHAAHKSEAA